MQKIKLTNALHIANETLMELEDRDINDGLDKNNPYALTNLDFDHFSETAIKLNFMIDNDCLYQVYTNMTLWLSYDADNDQMLKYEEVEDLKKQLNAIADDDYREGNINPSIVKFYRDRFAENWDKMFPKYAEQSHEPEYLKLLHNLVDQQSQSVATDPFKDLSAEQKALVEKFIHSIQ